jgi:hypothetical protein
LKVPCLLHNEKGDRCDKEDFSVSLKRKGKKPSVIDGLVEDVVFFESSSLIRKAKQSKRQKQKIFCISAESLRKREAFRRNF